MSEPSTPMTESERLQALRRLRVLDTAPQREFDALVAAAAAVCGVPISLISLVDENRQWFKANIGLPGVQETPRDMAFCDHAIRDDGILEVPDATADPRFATNPLVTGQPDIRFYAGAPLVLTDGARVGTLCVIDREPRRLDEKQREVLRLLSQAASQALESRLLARDLAASEARQRTWSEASPLGIYVTDAGGACRFTNARWQSIYGLHGDEALGTGWTRTLHPEDAAGVYAEWQRTAALRVPFDMEFRIRRDDGSVRHVRSMARTVVDETGAITGFVGSVEDVTERLREQRELAYERSRLAAIIDATGAGTWEWNVRSGEVRLNERSAAMIGYTVQELGALTIQLRVALTHPDDHPLSMAAAKAHLSGATERYESEVRMRHRDGHWVWIQARGQLVTRTADGQPEWMFGTHFDVTERKLAEETLRRSEAQLSRTGTLANVGGWELDIASGQLRLSEQAGRIHGLEPGQTLTLDEAIGHHAPEAQADLRAAVERAMVDGTPWDLLLPFGGQGGLRRWVRSVGQGEGGREGGRPLRVVAATQDVTERVAQRQALDEAHERMTLAMDSGGFGIWDWDLSNQRLRWDPWMYRLYGVAPDSTEDPVDLWTRHLHAQDRDAMQRALSAAIAVDNAVEVEFRIVRDDGGVRHFRASARISRNAAGRAIRMVGAMWDVTPLRELSIDLARQHELLRVTLHSIGDAVITTDGRGHVTWLNPVAERMTGWGAQEALGRPLDQVFHIVHEETRQPAPNPVAVCLSDGQVVGLANHTVLLSRNGEEFGIEDSAAPIRESGGQVLGVVLVFHDVTEQRRLSGEMSYRASHDALTGLVNRAEFESRLKRLHERSREDHTQHAMLFIDLDQFKLVNDACGHAVGDQLLQQVARLLRETVRARDTLARLGGDEFAVLLEHCTTDQAQRVAQQICDRMEQFRFVHDERRFRIGTSIGLVPMDRRWTAIDAVIQAADAACYAAKEAGRNRVHTWFDTDQAVAARHGEMQWATRLEQAIDEDRFVLYAQCITPLGACDGGCHAEVLIRLLDANGALIPPGAFLPAAERFHLATRIDRWVLSRAIGHVQDLADLTAVSLLSINLSGQSVGDRAFHRHAIDLLVAAGPAVCQRLCLEITETAAVTNLADAAVFIEQVRALGVRFALDDFGAGASSFGHLKSLKVDLLKIDGQFIKDLIDDPLDDAAVRCFVDVARVVGVQTVAEFVDRPEILQRVREIGIDFAQGFLLHRPEPIETVLAAALVTATP
ncbi:MAG: PAS domain-containing protein [Aquabacterium sp.]